MNKREFKNSIYSELAIVTKALGNAHRIEIIDLLAQGPFAVERIAEETNMSVANTSQHLQILKGARLVEVKRKGNHIYYQLASEKVFHTWRALRELGINQNSEAENIIRSFYNSHDRLEPVGPEELFARLENEDVIVIDVRSIEEYERGHIIGAISAPIDDLPKLMNELSKDTEIIAYCRGPLCVYAGEAVAMLNDQGFAARRLKEGFPDWVAMGFPVKTNYERT
jgi:rhodanese-related sulfurtransferase